MAHSSLDQRPWLHDCGVWGERVKTENIVHADLYAWHGDTFGIVLSAGGRTLISADIYAVRDDALIPYSGEAIDTRFVVRWTKDNNNMFSRVHGTLLNMAHAGFEAIKPYGYVKMSIHCHYVVATDANPWPRGWVNEYGAKAWR
jgi:hypothetical protein